MVEKKFSDSQYRFTEPVRYFKANDPYYFEVDNIPIKQLEENCLWLKDQLTKTTEEIDVGLTSVTRGDIEELKPYANGTDRVVRVKPGRFSARINDISSKDPLQYLIQILGDSLGDIDVFEFATNNDGSFGDELNTKLQAALDKFKSTSNPLFMTGLEERAFTWPVISIDSPVNTTGVKSDFTDAINYEGDNVAGEGAKQSPGLISQALLWAAAQNNNTDSFIIPMYETTNPSNGFVKLPKLESYFLKKWRGVTRFSIVDVPNELSIEVPSFDSDDFQYIDEEGTEQDVDNVTTRIDLVFLYAKPIDSSGARIVKNNEIVTITEPQLGLIRGAGLKYSELGVENVQTGNLPQAAYDAQGNPTILASPGDINNENVGFTAASGNDILEDVRGSFPAPDDLLNIAPLLSEKLEENALELIGQSILPLAYVVVQDTGDPLINGTQIISVNDVIDIRPFFRTAELTYNERAGLAASMPQVSLANPVVGKAQLDKEMYDMKKYVDLKTDIQIPEIVDTISVVGTGYIWGGWNFGPEGALWDFYKSNFIESGVDQNEQAKQKIKEDLFGLSNVDEISIPDYPDWDIAPWCAVGSTLLDKGQYPSDYINVYTAESIRYDNFDETIVAASFKELTTEFGTGPDSSVEPNRFTGLEGLIAQGHNNDYALQSNGSFAFIKKTIFFERPDTSNIIDYHIDLQFLNCVPLISGQVNNGKYEGTQYPLVWHGYWVEKGFNYFTVYMAFKGHDVNGLGVHGSYGNKVPLLNRDTENFSSWLVGVDAIINSNLESHSGSGGYFGNPRFGRCTLPTITWKMTAVPANKSQFNNGNSSNTVNLDI